MIYPTNFRETHRSDTALNRGGERIHFHGLDRSDYFFLSDTIIRVEAAHGGKHSILITTEGAVEVMATITALEKKTAACSCGVIRAISSIRSISGISVASR